jgi:hypothetical protein
MTEIDRELFGAGDGKAINRHSQRTYEMSDGRIVSLDRNLSFCPPAFELLGPHEPTFQGITPVTEVDGQRYFADGWSWKRAVAKMCEVLGVELVEESCQLSGQS